MTSLRSLAAAHRRDPENFYDNTDRNSFKAAVLEIAHAIRRGRKANSCSVLPGQNIQEWLRRTFVETHPFCHDFMGDPCSIADDMRDMLFGWAYKDPEAMATCRAIEVCRRLIRPSKKAAEDRGDWLYQERNKITNRKRKLAWRRRDQGSCYDDLDFDDYSDRFLDIEDESGTPSPEPEGDDPAPSVATGTVRRIRRVHRSV